MEIVNVFHPRGSNLPIARGVAGRYNDPDYGLSFDNTGKAADHRIVGDFAGGRCAGTGRADAHSLPSVGRNTGW